MKLNFCLMLIKFCSLFCVFLILVLKLCLHDVHDHSLSVLRMRRSYYTRAVRAYVIHNTACRKQAYIHVKRKDEVCVCGSGSAVPASGGLRGSLLEAKH